MTRSDDDSDDVHSNVDRDLMREGAPPFESIQEGFQYTKLSVYDVWVIYYALGGTATSDQLRTYLRDEGSLGEAQQRVLAQSLNELFIDAGCDHPVPYPA
jgi:hypothetical protein